MRRWFGAVGIQALGALATLGVGLLIAAAQGPQAQGRYGLLRSSADLLLAIALLGLPQGMVHLLNHLRASPRQVERWLRRYTLGLLVLAAVWLLALQDMAALALAVGVFGWVVHGLQRVFVLCRGSTLQFAWLTVVPALTLLAAVAALVVAGSQRYELVIAFSGLASAAAGSLVLRPLRRGAVWPQGEPAAWTALLQPSGHALVQTAALALLPWLSLQLLQRQHPAGAELGWFVLAGYVGQAFALPASFVAPLVFARASQAAGQGENLAVQRQIRMVGGVTLGLALLTAVLLPWLVPTLFGAAYAGAVGACVALALAGPALVVGRLHTALLLGAGRFASVTALFALRAALLPVCVLALWRWTPLATITAAAAGWALAEVLTALLQAGLRHTGQSPSVRPPT